MAFAMIKKQNKCTYGVVLRFLLLLACENIRFFSLFAAGEISRGTSPAAKSEEKRMFSKAILLSVFGRNSYGYNDTLLPRLANT